MQENEFQSIRSFAEQPGFTLEDLDGAFVVKFERDSLCFKVTVAYEVLEWYVEIIEPLSGLKFQDWADYTGYDKRPRDALVEEMTVHLHRLFKALVSRTFRLRKGRTWFRASDHCEWLKGDRWVEFDYSDT